MHTANLPHMANGYRIALGALWILWAGLLLGGLVFGRPDAAQFRRMPLWTRLGSSLALAAAAWVWVLAAGQPGLTNFALALAIGMSFGLLGDLFMARVAAGQKFLMLGMAAFGLGHLAYLLGIAALLFRLRAPLLTGGLSWIIWLMIGLAGWYFVVHRGQAGSLVRWMALLYTLLLASTAALATALARQNTSFLPLAIGAALFLLSDLILAISLFTNAKFPRMGDVIWLSYGPAQMLIVYSAGSAIKLAAEHIL